VTKHLALSAAGFLMQKEVDYLGRVLDEPKSRRRHLRRREGLGQIPVLKKS